MKSIHLVIFVLGLAAGLVLAPWLFGAAPAHPAADGKAADPRASGLPTGWLAFGYFGQALFTGRMLLQWIATEKKRQSVVPVLFWWFSLFGGLILAVYFIRRGDPVGSIGQIAGLVVYARNLVLIVERRRTLAAAGDEEATATLPPGAGPS